MADLSRIPKSKYIQSFTFVGDRYPYPVPEIKGDSYPMTWADDGEIYASSGDPNWGETTEGLDVEKFSGMAPDYVITKANHMNDYDGSGDSSTIRSVPSLGEKSLCSRHVNSR